MRGEEKRRGKEREEEQRRGKEREGEYLKKWERKVYSLQTLSINAYCVLRNNTSYGN